MNIKPQEITDKKEIGIIDECPVFQLYTKGGLYVIAAPDKKGGVKILGTGPHRLVAKHVAKKLHPGLVITELLKSEPLNPVIIERLEPLYINLTNRFNQLNG